MCFRARLCACQNFEYWSRRKKTQSSENPSLRIEPTHPTPENIEPVCRVILKLEIVHHAKFLSSRSFVENLKECYVYKLSEMGLCVTKQCPFSTVLPHTLHFRRFWTILTGFFPQFFGGNFKKQIHENGPLSSIYDLAEDTNHLGFNKHVKHC